METKPEVGGRASANSGITNKGNNVSHKAAQKCDIKK